MGWILDLVAIAVLAILVITTRGRVRRLSAEVALLRQELRREVSAREAGASVAPAARPVSVPDTEAATIRVAPPPPKPVAPRPPAPAREAVPPAPSAAETVPPFAPVSAVVEGPAPAKAAFVPSPAPAAPTKGLEERFGTRWVVWAGGIALVLGGIFLVQYSIEQGLIGPGVRIFLGALLAAGLLGAGEWIRRREHRSARPGFSAADIPSILTAAGTTVAFATVYAAHALYGFVDAGFAFVLLGAVALATLSAALVHGPWLAGLGLVGAFATPALVSTSSPSYWALAIYVVTVTAASLGLARIRHWRWLALAGVALGALWMLPGIGDLNALPAHVYHAAAGFALVAGFVVSGLLFGPEIEPGRIEVESSAALIVYLLAAALLVVSVAYAPLALATFVALAGASVLVAGRSEAATAAVPGAAILTVILVAAAGDLPGWTMLVDQRQLLVFGGGLAALFAAAGYLAQGRTTASAVATVWAATAAAAPIAILVALYYRVAGFELSPPFALASLAIAGVYAAATERLMQRAPRPGSAAASALFATAAIAALALALTFGLEQGWLSVGLALMVPGIAWVAINRPLPALRWLAAALALVVMARIAWEPRIAGADLGVTPILNWLLYGYGIPAASFWVGGILLRRRADDVPSRLVEAAAILFSVLLVFVEIRHLMNGDIYNPSLHLAEAALQVCVLLALAIGLERLRERTRSVVQDYGALILAALGLAAIVTTLVIVANPWWTAVDVGGPVFNLILLGYLLPAVLAAILAWTTRHTRPLWYRAVAVATAAGLGLLYLLLEAARLFRGPVLPVGPISEVEWYTYSALILGFGVALLLVASRLRLQTVRLVSGIIVFAGIGAVLAVNVVLTNPWWIAFDVGGPFFNLIMLGYLLPAVLVAIVAWWAMRVQPPWYHAIAVATAAGLGLIYLLLETARLFRGPILPIGPISDVEQYAYSAVILGYGVALLLVGIALRLQAVRLASAAIVLLAIGKVFLIDLAGLTGVYRALSFLGLGVALVGIGWLYQRLLFPRQAPQPAVPN